MNWLVRLYTEQTTPDEAVIFLLLGTFVTLLIAFVIYALVLLVLSRWRMKKPYSLRELLFPSAARTRKYAAEYTMGALTALLLTLTVSVKHEAVESVLAQDISLIGHEVVSSALPFGGVTEEELIAAGANPGSAQQLSSWLKDGAAESTAISTEALVRPLLEAGMTENANLIVREIVDQLGPAANSVVLQRILLIASFSLLFGYAIWFGVQRWKEMQREQVGEPIYAAIIKRLSVPAVCIPLLFVSAVALEDTERIVNSAIAAAGATEQSVETPLGGVIHSQAKVIKTGEWAIDVRDLEQLNEGMRNLGARIDDAVRQIAALDRQLSNAERDLNSAAGRINEAETRNRGLVDSVTTLKDELARVQEQFRQQLAIATRVGRQALAKANQVADSIDPLKAGMDSLQQDLDRLTRLMNQAGTKKSLLLVQNLIGNGVYVVRRGAANGTIVARGTRLGIHALLAGSYTVTANGARSESRNIRADGAVTVQLVTNFVVQ
ncbi:MAG: hypothetical protein O7D88_07415 [Gammaproteobacteria bacterium]|nr:hypothetical protein [Gammaproteobacteria bacterium]